MERWRRKERRERGSGGFEGRERGDGRLEQEKGEMSRKRMVKKKKEVGEL